MAGRATQFRKVAPALVEQRLAPRHVVVISKASVRRTGAASSEAVLHDISIYGCRIQSPLRHQVDERVWVRFPGSLPIAATVVWTDSDFTGCRFDYPMERAIIRPLTLVLE